MNCLKTKESPAIVKHILSDVAHLVSVYGEQHLRNQFRNVMSLLDPNDCCSYSGQSESTESSPKCMQAAGGCYYDGEWEAARHDREKEKLGEANSALLSSFEAMKRRHLLIHETRDMELKATLAELDHYKQLLVEERILNRQLKNRIEVWGCCSTSSEEGRERPVSCKSRKHRRDDCGV